MAVERRRAGGRWVEPGLVLPRYPRPAGVAAWPVAGWGASVHYRQDEVKLVGRIGGPAAALSVWYYWDHWGDERAGCGRRLGPLGFR